MKYRWRRNEAWGKVGALVLMSPAVYLTFCAFCSVCLPVGQHLAIVVGILGGFPVWIAAMCYAVLARSVVRAWLVPLALALGLGACTALALAIS